MALLLKIDVLEKEYPWVADIRKELLDIDMSELRVEEVMQLTSKGRRVFEEGDFGEVTVNSLELFTGVVSGKKGAGKTVNDVILEVAKEIGLNTEPKVDKNGNITLISLPPSFFGLVLYSIIPKLGLIYPSPIIL